MWSTPHKTFTFENTTAAFIRFHVFILFFVFFLFVLFFLKLILNLMWNLSETQQNEQKLQMEPCDCFVFLKINDLNSKTTTYLLQTKNIHGRMYKNWQENHYKISKSNTSNLLISQNHIFYTFNTIRQCFALFFNF